MIVRVFRARTRPGKAAAFRTFFEEKALPVMREQRGLVRVEIGWPMAPTDEFLMITVWRDLESLHAFVGDDWRQAKVLPEERPLLEEVFVHHYEAREEQGAAR